MAQVWGDGGQADLRREQTERALSRPGAEAPSPERVHCLWVAACCDADSAHGRMRLEEGLELAARIGDRAGEGHVLNTLGLAATGRRAFTEAQGLYERALAAFRDAGSTAGVARVLNNLGDNLAAQGSHAAAGPYFDEAIPLYRESGDAVGLAVALTNRTLKAIALRDRDAARHDLIEAVGITADLRSVRAGVMTLTTVGELALLTGNAEVAACLFAACDSFRHTTDRPTPLVAEEIARLWAVARERLGEDDFRRAWQTGSALSLADAHDYALRWLRDVS
jgi:tetratricopeptide (TPR) repeat protein